jgi:hypothetical protein
MNNEKIKIPKTVEETQREKGSPAPDMIPPGTRRVGPANADAIDVIEEWSIPATKKGS